MQVAPDDTVMAPVFEHQIFKAVPSLSNFRPTKSRPTFDDETAAG
jgi:hypothetical protein